MLSTEVSPRTQLLPNVDREKNMKKSYTAALFVFVFTIFVTTAVNVSGQLVISEFRVRGVNGANDEFIELYNNSGADHTVAGGGTGYGVAASNGVARCVIPNGTIIPTAVTISASTRSVI